MVKKRQVKNSQSNNNSQSLIDIEKRVVELSVLYEISSIPAAGLNIEEIYSLAMDKATRLMKAERAALFLYDELIQKLIVRGAFGLGREDLKKITIEPGEGIIGRAFKEGKSILLPDQKRGFRKIDSFIERFPVKSAMITPIKAGEKFIGVLFSGRLHPRKFTPEELRLFTILADRVGVAIENARLFETEKRRRQELTSLQTTSAAILSELDLRSLLQMITDKAAQSFTASATSLMLWDEREENLIIRASYGLSDEYVKQQRIPKDRVYSIVMPKGEFLPIVRKDLRVNPFGDVNLIKKERLCTVLTVPLLESGKLIGTLNIYSKNSPRVFSSDEIGLAQIFANQASIAIKNARLFESLSQRLYELSTVQEISRIVVSELELKKLLHLVVERASELTKAEGSAVNLLDDDKQTRTYVACYGENISKLLGRSRPAHIGLQGWVIKEGKSLLVNDVLKDKRTSKNIAREVGINAMVTAPLRIKGEIIGCLSVFNKRGNQLFIEHDLRILTIFADQVAVAIENARLFEKVIQGKKEWEETFDSIADAVSLHDKEHKILKVNKAFAQQVGITPRQVIGKKCYQIVHHSGVPPQNCPHIKTLLTKQPTVEEIYDPITKRTMMITCSPLFNQQGECIGSVHIAKDITEQKKLQEIFAQSEKMRALGEMAGGVAHDFNNVLAAILGRAELLLREVKSEKLRNWLKVIEQAALDGAETVRRIQEFTRLKKDESFVKVDMNQIVKDVLEVTKPKWKDESQKKGIKIEVRTELEDILPVNGNPSELREVLINMILNAVEAMPQGGKITLKTEAKGERVLLSIIDTGKGMSEEIKKRVFDPFFTTKGVKGTGLGLSVAYGIITRHGGKIDIESEEGKGTTFTIELPVALEAKQRKKISITLPKIEPVNILIIDDEDSVRSILSDILASQNHRVVAVASGREGLDVFKKDLKTDSSGKVTPSFDVVFTDLGMPEISGWEVAKAIKNLSPETPIILITGWGVQIDKKKVKECGVDLIVSKPFKLKQVLNMLREAMRLAKKSL